MDGDAIRHAEVLPAFDAGLRDVNVGRLEDARAAFERAACERDPRGWFAVGQLASEGRGDPENPAKAAALYQRAAEGCAPAARCLAALYALAEWDWCDLVDRGRYPQARQRDPGDRGVTTNGIARRSDAFA